MSSIFWGMLRGEGLRWRGGGGAEVVDLVVVVVVVRMGSAVGDVRGGC